MSDPIKDRIKEIHKHVEHAKERCGSWKYGLWSHEGLRLANDIEWLLELLETTTESDTND